jgi:ABC-type enterochelin transport system ATPase subunit
MAIDNRIICAAGIPAEVLNSKVLSSIYDTDMQIIEACDERGVRQLFCYTRIQSSV